MRCVKMCKRNGRRDQRMRMTFPCRIGDVTTVTRDMSMSGVGIVRPSPCVYEVGQQVSLTITTPTRVIALRAVVVRTDDDVMGLQWPDHAPTLMRVEELLHFGPRRREVAPAPRFAFA